MSRGRELPVLCRLIIMISSMEYDAAAVAPPAASMHAPPISPIRTPVIPNEYRLDEEQVNVLAQIHDLNN